MLLSLRRAAVTATGVAAALAVAVLVAPASHAVPTTQVVGFDEFNYWDRATDPTPPTLWWIDEEALGGAAVADIVNRTPAAALDGSVQLSTKGGAADSAVVGTLDAAGTAVSALATLAYSTRTNNAAALPRLEITAGCDAGADLRLVYDPTRFGNTTTTGGSPAAGVWQRWNAAAGTWYLSRALGALAGGSANGHALPAIQSACTGGSGAVVSHGLAAGPDWPAADTNADLVTVNTTTTDFLYDYAVRLAGLSRIDTAIAVSRNTFGEDDVAEGAVIARSDLFPDALAGVPLAASYGGPLLLTPPSTLLPSVQSELARVLAPGGKVFIMGGPGAVVPAVETALKAAFGAGNVVRLGGTTRFDTALLAANAVQVRADDLGLPYGPVLAATGYNFPDALSAGPAALGDPGSIGAVVLTADYTLPTAVRTFLTNAKAGGSTIVAVGGQAKGALGSLADVSFAGSTRYETSALVADSALLFPTGEEYWGLASGYTFPDALTGGVALGLLTSPVLITAPMSLTTQTGDLIKLRHTQLGFGIILGGVKAVTETAAKTAFGYASGGNGPLPYATASLGAGSTTTVGAGSRSVTARDAGALSRAVAQAAARVHAG